MNTMLFEHGDIHMVVEVLSVSPDAQASCRIVRTHEEYCKYKTRAQRELHRRLQHGSLHYGDKLEIPLSMLRPCPLKVRVRQRDTGSTDAIKSLALMVTIAAIVTAFFALTGAHH